MCIFITYTILVKNETVNNDYSDTVKNMKKKLLCGIIMIALLICLYFAQTDRASGNDQAPDSQAADTEPEAAPQRVLPDAAPDPVEAPAVIDGQYTLSMSSSIGTLTYYNQSDVRWADFLYGGRDPLHSYGCGPTALAMVVTSFTEHTLSPADMAAWAADHNYWSAGHGTKHNFIMEGAAAFGLKASPFQNFTEEGVLAELRSGHILIALMGSGHFTSNGHFIVIADDWSGNQVRIADPASLENTHIPWEISVILSELNAVANSGGPIWSISP